MLILKRAEVSKLTSFLESFQHSHNLEAPEMAQLMLAARIITEYYWHDGDHINTCNSEKEVTSNGPVDSKDV